jgi:hypothetical protein
MCRRVSLPLAGFSLVVSGAAGGATPMFSDHTAASGVSCQYAWPPGYSRILKMKAGGAVGDFDRDGDQDLFVLAGGASPDRLYINDGSGAFTDRAGDWGVALAHIGAGAAVADVDGDGWLDLFVTSHGDAADPDEPGRHLLYMNNRDGTFTDRAAEAGVAFTSTTIADGFGAGFGDYDLDGDLDLAVAGWEEGSGGNRLFRNDGSGVFEDVTGAAIPADLSGVEGFSPWFHDMDGDRFPELLWTSDFGTSRYLVNNGDGTFSDATGPSGTGLDSNGMGSVVADLSGDGRPDWYVTSIDNSVGGTTHSGNMLYINQGDHTYVETAAAANVNQGGWGWGTDAADLDLDGDLDLMWTNGWIVYEAWLNDPTFVCLNDGSGAFDVGDTVDTGVTHTGNGRGLLTFDADGDGDRDLVVFSIDVPTVVYRNELPDPDARGWLTVALDTSASATLAPDGVGCRVDVSAGGATTRRWVNASPNYLAQSEMTAHFGLGGAGAIDAVEVHWANGAFTRMTAVGANQRLVIAAPAVACVGDVTGDGATDVFDFAALAAGFGTASGATRTLGDLDGNGSVNIFDFSTLAADLGCAQE